MSAHIALFPESFALEDLAPTPFPSRWTVVLCDDEGNRVHLTEQLADELAALLLARKAEPKTGRKAA